MSRLIYVMGVEASQHRKTPRQPARKTWSTRTKILPRSRDALFSVRRLYEPIAGLVDGGDLEAWHAWALSKVLNRSIVTDDGLAIATEGRGTVL